MSPSLAGGEEDSNLVNYLKDSSLAREAYQKILEEAGVDPLSILQGTENRWFFKYSEVHRALLLKEHITEFFFTYDIPTTLEILDDDDWGLVLVYENALKEVVEAAKLLEGEKYPSASSVIHFLETIFEAFNYVQWF